MTPISYAIAASKYCTPESACREYLFPALLAEVGELLIAIDSGAPREDIAKEIGDCLWFALVPRVILGADAPELHCGTLWTYKSNAILPSSRHLLLVHAVEYASHAVKIVREPHRTCERLAMMEFSGCNLLDALAHVASAYGLTLEQCAALNLDKLGSRATRGVIAGDGDHR